MKPKTRRRVQKEEACYGWSTFCELERKRVRSLVAARRHWVSKSPNGAPLAAAAASGAHFPFFEDPPQHLYATGSLDNKRSLLKKNCNGITVIISIQQSPIWKKKCIFYHFCFEASGKTWNGSIKKIGRWCRSSLFLIVWTKAKGRINFYCFQFMELTFVTWLAYNQYVAHFQQRVCTKQLVGWNQNNFINFQWF